MKTNVTERSWILTHISITGSYGSFNCSKMGDDLVEIAFG